MPSSDWLYAEDRCGISGWSILRAVALTLIPVVAFLVLPASVASTLTGFDVFFIGIGWIDVYQRYTLGIRVSADVIWIGGVRRAERRQRAGKDLQPRGKSAAFAFRQLFIARREPELKMAIAIGADGYRAVLKEKTAPGKRRRRTGCFPTKYVPAHLLLYPRPGTTTTPKWGATTAQSGGRYSRVPTGERFVDNDVWATPTRRPDELRRRLNL
jgi:hypothetical protein